ncbi:MAG: hypothetical protein MZV49_00640 [Rhodopseudomonas palustris]|nr:hypothetical protein [Rhodopseudomonas palustris]
MIRSSLRPARETGRHSGRCSGGVRTSGYSEEDCLKFSELYGRTLKDIDEGQIVTGRVLAIANQEVVVRHRIQVGRHDSRSRNSACLPVVKVGDTGRRVPRFHGGPGRPADSLEEEGRFHARVGPVIDESTTRPTTSQGRAACAGSRAASSST